MLGKGCKLGFHIKPYLISPNGNFVLSINGDGGRYFQISDMVNSF